MVNYSAGLQHLKSAPGFEGMSGTALRSRVRRGTIPHIRRQLAKNVAIMFDLDVLNDWMEGQRAGPGGDFTAEIKAAAKETP